MGRLSRFFSLALLLGLCGAGSPAAAQRARNPSLDAGLMVLEEAVNALASPTADYRQVVERAAARLPGNLGTPVAREIQAFLHAAPSPSADFRCSADFMRDRARRELWRLKDLMLDWNPMPVEPRVCHAVPIAIDTAQLTPTLEIYGFDFDQVPLELFLMDDSGFFKDVTSALTKRSRYHLSVDLRKGLRFSPDTQSVALAWGHLVRYSIPLIKPSTPLCLSSIEEVPAGKSIAYMPLSVGDASPSATIAPNVTTNVALDYESNKIDATVCLTTRGGPALTGCGVEYVYTTDSARVIEWVFADLEEGVVHAVGSGGDESLRGVAHGPVDTWAFHGFGSAAGPGIEPEIAVTLRKVRLVSTQPERCVSATRYLEARHQNAIGARSARRLDPQLKPLDPDILKLRPRYAPPGF